MDLILTKLVGCVRSTTLRYQKPWRIDQSSVIDRKFPADRRFQTQPHSRSVRPECTQILSRDIVRRHSRRFENVAYPAENIAAVVKRHNPH